MGRYSTLHIFEPRFTDSGKSDIIQFIHETVKQFTNRFVIGITPLRNCKHHISYKNNRHMRSQSVIGQAPALFYQM